MNGERPTRHWWYKQVTVPVRHRFSKRMRFRKVCVCENLIDARKLLANQRKDGDSPIQCVSRGLFVKKAEKVLWMA